MTNTDSPSKPKSSSTEKKDKSDPLRYRQTLEIITTPIKFWYWLCIASASGFLLWSVAGRIPEKVSSNGVIINPFEINTIKQPNKSGGVYTSINVKPGDIIQKNDIIARVSFEDLDENVYVARETLKASALQYQTQYESPSYQQLRSQQIQAEQNNLKYYNEAKALAKTGTISESSVISAQQKYESALQSRLSQKNDRLNALSNQKKLGLKLKQAIATRDAKSIIRSPYDGKIVSVYVQKGQSTTPNSALLEIDANKKSEKNLSFISYFSPTEAAKILVGQSVHILPDTIKPNTVGNLFGKITYVSETPSSTAEASSILGNKELAENLVTSRKNIRVDTQLITDTSYPSGFKWINGNGPPKNKPYQFPRVGVAGNVNVITKKVPPITIGIPALKKFFGLE